MIANRTQRALFVGVFWALSIGAIGFICGYFGNGLLAADPGTAGPLNFFLTTPPSIAIGGGLGALAGSSRMTGWQLTLLFLGLALSTAVVCLAVTAPEFRPEGNVVEAEVLSCTSASTLIPDRVSHWESEAARVTREGVADVRANWRTSVPEMLRSRPGVVLTIRVIKSAWVKERIWRTGRKDRKLSAWRPANYRQDAFVSDPAASCTSAPVLAATRSRLFLLCWEPSEAYPPSSLPEFLGIFILRPHLGAKQPSTEDLVRWATAECNR